MDYNMPGFPVLHYHQELAQTHVHWVSDAIQTSTLVLPPSPPALNLSQYQGLFQWVGSSHQVAKVSELQCQHCWSFSFSMLELQLQHPALEGTPVFPMNIQDWFPLGLTGLTSLQSKRLSRVFSSTTFHKHQFFGAQPSLRSTSHIHTWLLEKP